MTEFEPLNSSIESNLSANWATITARILILRVLFFAKHADGIRETVLLVSNNFNCCIYLKLLKNHEQ